jgi:hypothetical protein
MSEYQYYEFQAIDHPLAEADVRALRALSTRARITATSFINSYEWGNFKGDPATLMKRWFDLHLYLANWGTHRLMIRLPRRLLDRQRLDRFLRKVECVELKDSGENLIVDILRQEIEPEEEWDDGSGWLGALAPLRADLLAGDLRAFYLLWLTAVEADALKPDETEPLPGIGPMTGALDAFVRFFGINADLVAAAAERPADPMLKHPLSSSAARRIVAELPEHEKIDILTRLLEGDAHVAYALRALVRDRLSSKADAMPVATRTVGELRTRADAIRRAREDAKAKKAEAERKRKAEEAERSRRARINAIAQRGEEVWREIEAEIMQRNAVSYDRAVGLLVDLRAIADERGTVEDFTRRLREIRERHARKAHLIKRLKELG